MRTRKLRWFPYQLSILLAVILVGLAFGSVTAAQAQESPPLPPGWPDTCVTEWIPSGSARYPAQQAVAVCVPGGVNSDWQSAWNGGLIVYAHGYVSVHPSPDITGIDMADAEIEGVASLVPALNQQGYAFATTSYSKKGYALEAAQDNINALVAHFNSSYAPASQVLITGASEGGIITAMMLERFPDTYAGGLALCGPVGGMPYQVRYLGDFRVVFDYFFPGVLPGSASDVPPDAWQAWVENPDGSPDYVLPAITDAMNNNPDATQQLFDVTRAPQTAGDPSTRITTAQQALYYSIWGTNDVGDTAGGQPYDNQRRFYFGADDNRALNRGVERVSGDAAAQNYIQQYYDTTGQLQRPLVTLHTTADPAVPLQHELIYVAKVHQQGQLDNLIAIPIPRYGHCTFTDDEILAGFSLLLYKVNGELPVALPDWQAVFSRMNTLTPLPPR